MKKYTTPIVCMVLLVSAILSSYVSKPRPSRTVTVESPALPDGTKGRPTMLVIPSTFVPQPPGPPRTSFVMQWTVDPSNGAPGYLDLYTAIEVSTNGGKTWAYLDKVWGPTNQWTVPLDPTVISHWFRTRWSPTNIVIHPL